MGSESQLMPLFPTIKCKNYFHSSTHFRQDFALCSSWPRRLLAPTHSIEGQARSVPSETDLAQSKFGCAVLSLYVFGSIKWQRGMLQVRKPFDMSVLLCIFSDTPLDLQYIEPINSIIENPILLVVWCNLYTMSSSILSPYHFASDMKLGWKGSTKAMLDHQQTRKQTNTHYLLLLMQTPLEVLVRVVGSIPSLTLSICTWPTLSDPLLNTT